MQGLTLEQEGDDDGKNGEGNHLLDHFELEQVKGTAVPIEADAVGRHREAVLEKGDAPGKKDDENERPAGGNFHLLQLEMAIPGERHEHVREHQHENGPETLHIPFVIGPQN